jgi:hypothetical protein
MKRKEGKGRIKYFYLLLFSGRRKVDLLTNQRLVGTKNFSHIEADIQEASELYHGGKEREGK